MVPLQYILPSQDLDDSLSTGCHWLQLADASRLADADLADLLARCHSAGAYLVLTDAVGACSRIAADGVLLTSAGISATAARVPEPTGIVLQRPRPVTLAIAEARRTLGEESPQFVGVQVDCPEDAVAAAKAGADFIQAPIASCTALLCAVRDRSFTTPVVALGAASPDEIDPMLDEGISGIACDIREVPPVMIPLLLNADE